jgi:hypothetical protein
MDIIFYDVIVLIFDQYVFTHLQPFPNLSQNLYQMTLTSSSMIDAIWMF